MEITDVWGPGSHQGFDPTGHWYQHLYPVDDAQCWCGWKQPHTTRYRRPNLARGKGSKSTKSVSLAVRSNRAIKTPNAGRQGPGARMSNTNPAAGKK